MVVEGWLLQEAPVLVGDTAGMGVSPPWAGKGQGRCGCRGGGWLCPQVPHLMGRPPREVEPEAGGAASAEPLGDATPKRPFPPQESSLCSWFKVFVGV